MYEKIAHLIKEGRSFAVATVVKVQGSAPRGVSAKMIVLSDGSAEGTVGGGELELRVKEDALAAIEAGVSCLKEYKLTPTSSGGIGMVCGGDTSVFIEVVNPAPKLLICGAGHIGVALYKMAMILGFRVIVVDDKKEFAVKDRFPLATVHCCDIDAGLVSKIVDKNTLAVIATGDHSVDEQALSHLLRTDAKYIGMIGSKTKFAEIKKRLVRAGTPKDKLAQIFTPIGIDIGAETPEEIAISILGEIIHFLRRGKPSPVSLKNA